MYPLRAPGNAEFSGTYALPSASTACTAAYASGLRWASTLP
jgi:hypothetical protein